MLSAQQLCTHLCYMLHTPARLYDAVGNCLTNELVTSDQEDPLVCDPDFAAELLAMRQSAHPVLHTEDHDTVYAVIPTGADVSAGTLLLYPPNCDRLTDCFSKTSPQAPSCLWQPLRGILRPIIWS